MTAPRTAARSMRRTPSRRPCTGQQLLDVAPRSLVVLAGLPGAGKTTLLRSLDAGRPTGVRPRRGGGRALVRARAGRVPYRLLRPLVHGLHLLLVLCAVSGPAASVLTTDPITSTLRRALLRVAATSSGRRLDVVLVEATAEQARLGQASRGRALGDGAWLGTSLGRPSCAGASTPDAGCPSWTRSSCCPVRRRGRSTASSSGRPASACSRPDLRAA